MPQGAHPAPRTHARHSRSRPYAMSRRRRGAGGRAPPPASSWCRAPPGGLPKGRAERPHHRLANVHTARPDGRRRPHTPHTGLAGREDPLTGLAQAQCAARTFRPGREAGGPGDRRRAAGPCGVLRRGRPGTRRRDRRARHRRVCGRHALRCGSRVRGPARRAHEGAGARSRGVGGAGHLGEGQRYVSGDVRGFRGMGSGRSRGGAGRAEAGALVSAAIGGTVPA